MHNHTYRSSSRGTSTQPGLAVRSKVWLVFEGSHAFGTGLACLLDNISNYGMLTRAAVSAGMSYRHAWNLIRSAERHLGLELIFPQPGGVGGGHTELSTQGRRLLETYKRLHQDVAEYAKRRFCDLCSG